MNAVAFVHEQLTPIKEFPKFKAGKISDGVGVERLFPVYSPNIESILVHKVGKVRRAKLFYQRERSGKSARIREKRKV
jgi:large subunit ribosomal protein L19